MIKNYLFDLDDTLIDTKIYARLYQKILSMIKSKKKLTGTDLDAKAASFGLKKNKFGRWDTGDLCRELGLLDDYYKELEKLIAVEQVLHDAVEEVFIKIKKNKQKIGIVSNSMHRTIQLYLKKYGLSKYIDFIFSSDDVGCLKNKEKYWETLVGRHDLNPQDCLMVGDDELEDIKIPASFGFNTFLIKNKKDLEKVPI